MSVHKTIVFSLRRSWQSLPMRAAWRSLLMLTARRQRRSALSGSNVSIRRGKAPGMRKAHEKRRLTGNREARVRVTLSVP